MAHRLMKWRTKASTSGCSAQQMNSCRATTRQTWRGKMYAKRLFVASALLSASLVAQAGWNLSGWNNDLYAYVELPAVTLKVAQFWYRVDFNQPAFAYDAIGTRHEGVRKAVYFWWQLAQMAPRWTSPTTST